MAHLEAVVAYLREEGVRARLSTSSTAVGLLSHRLEFDDPCAPWLLGTYLRVACRTAGNWLPHLALYKLLPLWPLWLRRRQHQHHRFVGPLYGGGYRAALQPARPFGGRHGALFVLRNLQGL